MRITLTGSTGFIGKELLQRLAAEGHSLAVLARKRPAGLPGGADFFAWDASQEPFPEEALRGSQAVIHLAGEPVAQRWSADAKRRIRDSRLNGTRRLVEALSTMSHRPEVLVSASAIGFYGDRGDETLAEDAMAGKGFLPDLCVEWERAAKLGEALGIRVVHARIGVVLSADGGALARMLPPFRLGAGGPVGNGQQWMSWIHRADVVELLRWAVMTPAVRGPLNLTAPNPAMNADFAAALGRALHRPAMVPVPTLALRILFGEMAEVVLDSQRVLPRAALRGGFVFRFPELGPALTDLLG
jgi:uncharacterized protein (TIGR01777 family)